jgi:hypothetical protein
MGESRGANRVFMEKPEGKRSLGKPRRRCEDYIKMGLQEMEWGRGGDRMVWTGSIWLRISAGGVLL